MTHEEFAKTLFDSPDEMLPKGTSAQDAIDILAEHFLGEYIVNYPASPEQWNSEVVYEILRRFPSGKFRRIPKSKTKIK